MELSGHYVYILELSSHDQNADKQALGLSCGFTGPFNSHAHTPSQSKRKLPRLQIS